MSFPTKMLAISTLLALLLCLGCEPEPKTQAPQVTEMTKVEPEQAEPPQQAEPAPTEPVAEQVTAEPEAQPQPQAPAEPEAAPNDVAVYVNGVAITEQQIEEMIKPRLEGAPPPRRGVSPEQFLEERKKRLRDGGLNFLITQTLVDKAVADAGIVITDEQIEKEVQLMAASRNRSVEQLKEMVTGGGRMSFEQWKQRMQFPERLGIVKLAELKGLGTTDVNDAELRKYYDDNSRRFETPEMVRASHILITPDTSDPNIDPNQADADARQKAEQLLAQIKAGADFAELARANSACPSAKNGGDLGFNTRRAWVKPFADAAFALDVNQVSDVVKTRFGYHIIKLTGRNPAVVTTFEQAKDQIAAALTLRKQQRLIGEYLQMLRDNAQIVYPEGKEPVEPPRPRRPIAE